jgi:tRNA modification GTPase
MPSFDVDDTIAAIASAAGSGLRGIVRISGPDCLKCLENCFSTIPAIDLKQLNSPIVIAGEMILSSEPSSTWPLPGELMVWPTQRSYTRQPSAEFHTFGSPPLLKSALAKICQSGARLAKPGEFTLRAFLSGRLDLTQAEAVLAIIDAEAPTQLNGALKQLAGGLTGPLTGARDQLKFILAELEAGLDFVEEDIEFISPDELLNRLDEVQQTLQRITNQINSRDRDTDLIRVALVGLPNAGKSSLFNRLLESERAIVTAIPGTTTDFLSSTLDINGLKIELIDTAGLEPDQASESVSDQAQQQRNFAQSISNFQLLCVDSSRNLTPWERKEIENIAPTTILVQTKSDLSIRVLDPALTDQLKSSHQFVETSSRTSDGLIELSKLIELHSLSKIETAGEIVGATVLRAADSLRSAEHSVHLAQTAAAESAGEEVIAAEIRVALDDLGLVVGTVYNDDILDIVFSRFCIGK